MADIFYDVDTALAEVPVNMLPLLDATDFKTIEDAVAYNAAGLALYWHFVTTGGAYTVTAVTPTSGGNYDWTDQGAAGVYTIEIPASGGASINNDTEGFGWFTGVATGVLPWRGPVCGFRAAAINNSLIDGATVDVNVTAMAAGVVTASAVATGAIDADAIADNAIDAGAIATGAITSAKFAAGAIDAAAVADGAIDLATFAADAKALMGVVTFGTMQAGSTGTTAVLAASTSFADSIMRGSTLFIYAGTGAGQPRVITNWVSATDTATVDTWDVTPDNTSQYVVFATAPSSATAPITANVTQWAGSAVATPSVAGVPEVDVTHNAGTAITAAAGVQEVKVASIATNAITAAATATDFGAEIADAVWDEATSGHTTAGTTGKALTDASSAGDPWSTALPGAYGAGTAGYLIGTNVNATVSSRASQTSVDTIDGIVDSILVDTAEIGVAGAGLTAINLPDQTMNITGNITGNLSGSVGSVTGAVGSVTGNVGGNVVGSVGSVTGLTTATIADQVWDEALAGHAGAGSAGEALSAAGTAGDPWTTALPGAYGAGTAGYLVGTYLDAAVSTAGGGLDAAGVRAAVGLASANLDTQLAALPTATENADALLGRNVAGGADGTRTVSQAFYVLRNKVAISAGTLTVYGTDDSTPAFTAAVTTSAGDPVSTIDPA